MGDQSLCDHCGIRVHAPCNRVQARECPNRVGQQALHDAEDARDWDDDAFVPNEQF